MKIFTAASILNAKFLNNKGFTLVETLFAFSIFCLVASFLPLTVRIIMDNKPVEIRVQRLEWEVFVSQIKKEIRMSSKITVTNQTIALERDGQIIIYERYGSNLRKRVDNKGHEILLQQVDVFQFDKLLNGVRIRLTDRYGHEYREEIRSIIRNGV